ncbi:MAG TPA: gliding motility-associated C-terminal domain-containing protein, partial [Turneriella sp.]|nr:gliding motility-associated C-terminal domain-containing protein [Turneriella sp.]
QYRWFLFSLGYSAHNTISIHDGFRMGVGAAEHFTFGDAFLFYNLNIAKENNTATHGIVASVRLGGIDSDPPEITFTPDGNSFSPNDDGVRDLLIFNATVSDKSPVVYYELRIHDANGKMVYQLKSDERLREKSFSFALFFRSFLAPRARADIPEQFTWNGRVFSDASKKVKDTVFEDEPQVEKLPDGTYHYEFWVLDEKNNESKHATGAIIIDTKKPIASVELDSDLISPNGDGQRDILTITQEVTTDDSYEAFVLATNGEKVRRYAWKNNAPTRVEFDGKKDNGDLLAEGVYRYQLVGYNAAGNRNEAMSGNFYVSRRVDTVFLKSSNVGLNPLQKSFAEVVLSPSVTYSEGYKEGAIFIRKDCESKKEEDILFQLPVTTLEESATAKNKKSKKNKSALYVWRGESKDGKRLPDGVYCLSFRAHYENGNTPVSPPVQIVLDTTGPELDVVADLEVRQFSPDGDGENEEQVFRLSSDDLTGIDSYALTIEEVVITDKETKYLPVRRFEGKGIMPRSIYWDGRTESGALVESLTQYQYTLSAVDNYGNTSTTQGRRFETGVLVTPRVNGFFIRLPQVQLDNLTGDTARLLLSTLNKYAKYKIKLEVHTTPSRGIETGLRRTEKAARALYGYFVDKGIAPDRLSYQGFGDTAPVYRGAVAVKNNRVDVYLSR